MSAARTILFCSLSSSTIGGVENWLDRLCAGLDPRRWRPLVALVRGSRANDPDRFRAAHPTLETVEIDGRGLPRESRVRAVMRCVRRVDPALFVPLVLADAHEAAARLRCSSRRWRYVLALHGHTAPQLLEARDLVDYADFAVGPGRLTCELLRHLGMPEDRLRSIANGAREPEVARRERSPGAALRLGYVGRLTNVDKRVGDLVPLVKALTASATPFHLTIAGDGPERAALVQALAPYPVTFLGALTVDQLYRDVYPELDVLVLCSESESFGIVLVEAMLHGVVPVTSDFVGRASEAIVVDESTGLVFPVGDAVVASKQVARLALEPELLGRLSQAGRDRVCGRYAWARCVEAWDAALQSALALPSRQVPEVPPRPAVRASGMLDRLGLPAAMVDAMRRARRAVVGVSGAMQGGEEWPWTHLDGSAVDLDAMLALRDRLDRTAGTAHG